MNKRQSRKLETHLHTVEALRRLKLDDPALKALEEKFNEGVERLKELSTSQGVAQILRGGYSKRTSTLRQQLRNRMKKIAGIARLPDMKHVPGIEGLKQVPHANTRPAELIRAARAMAKRISPAIAREYKRLKFESGFTAHLVAAARALQESEKEAGATGNRRSYATTEIKRVMSHVSALRNAIGGVLAERMQRDSALALRWKQATRIGPKLGRPSKRSQARTPRTG